MSEDAELAAQPTCIRCGKTLDLIQVGMHRVWGAPGAAPNPLDCPSYPSPESHDPGEIR